MWACGYKPPFRFPQLCMTAFHYVVRSIREMHKHDFSSSDLGPSYYCLGFPRCKKERRWFHENGALSNEETRDKLEATNLVVQENERWALVLVLPRSASLSFLTPLLFILLLIFVPLLSNHQLAVSFMTIN